MSREQMVTHVTIRTDLRDLASDSFGVSWLFASGFPISRCVVRNNADPTPHHILSPYWHQRICRESGKSLPAPDTQVSSLR